MTRNEIIASVLNYSLPAAQMLSEDLEEVKRLRAELAECRAWILRHGEHDQNCGVFDLDDEGRHCACTCGLAAALAADGGLQ